MTSALLFTGQTSKGSAMMSQDFSVYREPADYHHSHLRDNISTSGSHYAPSAASHAYSKPASSQTFTNSSPLPYPGQYRSSEEYIATPDSAVPIQQQQQAVYNRQVQAQVQQQQQMYQQQVYAQSGHPLSSQVAGPSSYRKPSANSVPSSAAIPEYHGGQASGSMGITQGVNGHGGVDRRDRGNRMIDADAENDGRVGVEDPRADRVYTELKCLGDGSFGTVWLCDWHSPVKPDVLLSAMQCGAGARPEWSGKRLVALKRMKRVWEGGWTQAKSLGELVSLRNIPPHPAIIPLYDAFISPKSHELYFVFECMEGNLYQLTKSRRGRPLAAGLIASCFHQISSGLYHIHGHGYFHRDMKPENLLVTTTGLADYLTAEALAKINIAGGDINRVGGLAYEKDVSVIVKLADFGLARATNSKPPYTEYVSTRWYRAPEVLLRSSEYGPPVDMWALGTILAEMLNLKPLFPGVSEIDQVYRICDTMGDPSAEYGVDERGMTIGGGPWNSGIKLAKNVGFSFPKRKPVRFRSLFNDNVPQSLVDCIADLLRYNPKYRMTAAQCIDHPYFHETLPHLQQTLPLPRIPFSAGQPPPNAIPRPTLSTVPMPPPPDVSVPARQLPPSHAHTPREARPAFANGDIRTLPPPMGTPDSQASSQRTFFPQHIHYSTPHASSSALVHQLRELDLPTDDLASYGQRPPEAAAVDDVRAPQYAQSPAQLHQWVGDLQIDSHKPSATQSMMYDNSVIEKSQGGRSNQSLPNYSNVSLEQQPQVQVPLQSVQPAQSYGRSNVSVAAYVQQQQRYAQEAPAQQVAVPAAPPPIEPTVGAARAEKLGVTGKKKKWGLSSVFGGADKSTASLAAVDEHGYNGASLKRTQSGHRTTDRNPSVAGSSLTLGVPTLGMNPGANASSVSVLGDPKKAKKEAERQAKELAKAQREAAALKQKERARAVMQKRNQLIESRSQLKTKGEIEYSSTNLASEAPTPNQDTRSIYASSSASVNQMRNYAASQANQSLQSIRSQDSGHSGHSGQSGHSGRSGRSGLNASALADLDEHGRWDEMRHKARRRDDDDDHSMSSFGHNSLRSRSVLTVGTVDSDPGPRRRSEWADPLLRRDKRAPSASSASLPFHPQRPQSIMSRSNASLESQLAHDFKVRANVGAASSTGSLSRLAHAQSQSYVAQVPVHGSSSSGHLLPIQGHAHGLEVSGYPETIIERHDSAPTSPYGHSKGAAVAMGVGIARNGPTVTGGTVLPSISSWGEVEGEGQINPMFRVPPAEHQQPAQTLPPFSNIANYALKGQNNQSHPPQ
ncbi:CMGC/RCK protein kinase [Cryptococcus neoformans]|nr:meiosis induction protein kinase IME2/SME1 [Cryptococcus neoformans var. grubii Th84]OXH01124.1 CMGC/RCK protein kinase [Cryptococcus neoformans var. grubii]OXH23141.1 meiosis induction protein kinase IME2/SME1 [Cryptococcus neoformans var. grubii]OXH42871.1 meiosis induction protein kinase IME2/SME1 [Cryptococcus neoformans var. grubii]OXH43605.1 meiosis induction protein kinase IME2/SME1 [Cryptococcus neoformans var. grubii]